MRTQRPRRVLPILLLLATSLAYAAQAQEVGAFASVGWSEQTEIPRPLGYGVFLTTPSLAFLALRLSYDEQASRSERQATVCDSYWPSYTNCAEEQVRIGIGGGGSTSWVDADVGGKESGRSLGLVVPENRQPGCFLLLTTDVQRILRTPLFLSSAASLHDVRFDGCATDSYTPFCGAQTITELQIGLGYRF